MKKGEVMKHAYTLLLCFIIYTLQAHQPHLVQAPTITISNPEISQAFYATEPATYVISSQEPFSLYVQILRPKISELDKDISVTIEQDGKQIALLDGNSAAWMVFHEPFSNNDYYQGPSITLPAQGNYTLIVHGTGKYVLVVGQKERWPLSVIIRTYYSLPAIKRYFNESPLLAYYNLSGAALAIAILTLGSLTYIGYRLIKK